MTMHRAPTLEEPERRSFNKWALCVIAMLSFAVGSALTGWVMREHEVRADSHRVFELMVYHTVPGKVGALESIFRDVSKLQAKHGLPVVGYWIPEDNPVWTNTFIYLVAHPSMDDAKRNWHALHADPAFLTYRKSAEPLIEKMGEDYKVDEVYMRATDFSAMR